jgi:uncharacterized delta-60 repeat protein
MTLWPGTLSSQTTITPLSLSYPNTVFLAGSNSEVKSPTVAGGLGTKTWAVTGTLPTGITFNSSNGTFVGPVSGQWGGVFDSSFGDSQVVNEIWAVAPEPTGGKVFVGGLFSFVGGTAQSRVARLNANGTLDTTFANPAPDGFCFTLDRQSDGKPVVGGSFNTIGGATRNRVARLNTNGTLDTTFGNPVLDGDCRILAVQADGKVVVGGQFSLVGGVSRQRLARLNSNGTLDTTFGDPAINGTCLAIAFQSDGKIVVGGEFTNVGGQPRAYVARLNANGTLDTTFGNPGLTSFCYDLALQSDGKVVVVGSGTTVVRLNSNGTPDATYANPTTDGMGYSVAIQSDGKAIIGGTFINVGSQRMDYAARLNADGTLDRTFINPLLNDACRALAVTSSGTVFFAGNFTFANDIARSRIARYFLGPVPVPSTVNVTVTDSTGLATAPANLNAATAPTTPTSLTASGVGTTISASWVAPSDSGGAAVTGYNVRYSSVSATGPWTTWSTNQAGTSATITGLASGSPYWVAVGAVNAAGVSADAVASAPTYVTPGIPTGLTGTASYQFIDFAWTAPASTGGGITDYVLQRSPDNSTWTTITDGVSTATTYRLSGLADGQVVFFRVAALNPSGTGEYAASISRTTLAPKATGGTITYVAPNFIHTFTAAGTFTPTSSIATATGLCVAGGYNGAGGGAGGSGAGGSGGQVTTGTQAVSTARSIAVGAVNGGTSSISGWLTAAGIGVTGPAGRNTNGVGTAGANGTTSAISGTSTVYGSSGGAGSFSNTTTTQGNSGAGTGAGNGGRGRSTSTSLNSGTAATGFGSGGGGGGGTFATSGGAGRQGVVIISYPA